MSLLRTLIPVALLLFLGGTAHAKWIDTVPSVAVLPLEVQTVNHGMKAFKFQGDWVANARTLSMTIHNAEYPGKVRFWYGSMAHLGANSRWQDIDDNTPVAGTALNKLYNTKTYLIPIKEGTISPVGWNALRFKWGKSDDESTGYRILDFEFLDSAGHALIPAGSKTLDNPALWRPPLNTPTDISAGQALWSSVSLKRSPMNLTALPISCADCHAQDGRDLKYFNYSNYSIIQRAVFHGLTETQGQQIASYIRSLPYPSPGRPWNPPYQPGAGLDSLPVTSWAAGAGLGAVLARDADALPKLLAMDTSLGGTLNLRELPTATQFLDWNHWLPRIHPADAWGRDFLLSKLNQHYAYIRSQLALNNPAYMTMSAWAKPASTWSGLAQSMGAWVSDAQLFTRVRTTGTSSPLKSESLYSTFLWQRVKVWELMQEFGLEGKGAQVFGRGYEGRSWYDTGFFNTSPGMMHLPMDANGVSLSAGQTPTALTSTYLTNAWYALQTTLYAGNRPPIDVTVVDWQYFRTRPIGMDTMTGVGQPVRLAAIYIKGMQQADANANGGTGVKIRPEFANDISNITGPGAATTWNALGADKGKVWSLLTNRIADYESRYTPAQYQAWGYAKPTDPLGTYLSGGNWLTKTRLSLPLLQSAGVDAPTLKKLSAWGKTMWPAQTWPSF